MSKTAVIALGTLALLGLTTVLMVVGFAAGAVWTRARAADDGAWYGRGMMGYDADDDEWGYGMMGDAPDYGMMGDGLGYGVMGGADCAYRAPAQSDASSLEEAAEAFEAYVDDLGYPDLEITEVMEFERNYYAIAAEKDTGTGAMELLLDKDSGFVGPEPGPNMMWNAEYGMMGGRGGMMGGYGTGAYAAGQMTLSPEDAQDVAQRWLDANMPGAAAGEADPFYGYYTLHFLEDGEIAGMLSMHGSSGDVWYHSWHGDFVDMVEGHD